MKCCRPTTQPKGSGIRGLNIMSQLPQPKERGLRGLNKMNIYI